MCLAVARGGAEDDTCEPSSAESVHHCPCSDHWPLPSGLWPIVIGNEESLSRIISWLDIRNKFFSEW